MRSACWLTLAFVCASPAVRAQETPDLDALDRQVQKAIGRADKGIATLFVGRSEHYAAPSEKAPGVLGRYDAADLLAKLPADDAAGRRRVEDLDLAAPGHVPETTATGLILDKGGLVLTAGHAVARARKVYVKLPGGKGSYADIHALDPRSDLAVLKLLDPPAGLEPVTLGDGGAVRRGQLVLLLASPFAPGFRDAPTASWGMVTNLRRRLPGPPNEQERTRQTLHHYGTLLQVESKLNLPTSGGAVLNLQGEVVGLTTAHAAQLGSDVPGGFAIPFDAGLRRIVGVLLKGDEVEYGFLGVRLGTGVGRGAEVTGVTDGSPAASAGFRGGETIVRIDGQPVADLDDLFLLVGTRLAGSPVEVEYQRPGTATRKVKLTLAKFWVATPGIAANRPGPVAGLTIDWTSLLGQRNNFGPWNRNPTPVGVLIRDVAEKSPAAEAGLQVDDVITHVGKTPVATPAEFHQAVAQQPAGKLELTIEGRPERVVLPR